MPNHTAPFHGLFHVLLYLACADSGAQLYKMQHWWRVFTSQLPLDGVAEGLVSWFLLYRFRTIERLVRWSSACGL
jgi:hypothetical protein